VSRAIHGFEGKIFVIDFKGEHIIFVVLPVARSFPEGRIVHVGGADFLEAASVVFLADKGLEGVVNSHPVWEEKATSWGQLMEEEEFLFLQCINGNIPLSNDLLRKGGAGEYSSDFTMVTFGGFLEELLVFGHLFFIRE
jgi:hypothetical protein